MSAQSLFDALAAQPVFWVAVGASVLLAVGSLVGRWQ